jgi:hypothetical protein
LVFPPLAARFAELRGGRLGENQRELARRALVALLKLAVKLGVQHAVAALVGEGAAALQVELGIGEGCRAGSGW